MSNGKVRKLCALFLLRTQDSYCVCAVVPLDTLKTLLDASFEKVVLSSKAADVEEKVKAVRKLARHAEKQAKAAQAVTEDVVLPVRVIVCYAISQQTSKEPFPNRFCACLLMSINVTWMARQRRSWIFCPK
jgi:4-hydroxy-3-methylbut-2-en-1-yl diphosphate synthase IspG/GcpE